MEGTTAIKSRTRRLYGRWTCEDGREVYFDRGYHPFYERMSGGATRLANPREWVEFIDQKHFYNDGTSEKGVRRAVTAVLKEIGIPLAEYRQAGGWLGRSHA